MHCPPPNLEPALSPRSQASRPLVAPSTVRWSPMAQNCQPSTGAGLDLTVVNKPVVDVNFVPFLHVGAQQASPEALPEELGCGVQPLLHCEGVRRGPPRSACAPERSWHRTKLLDARGGGSRMIV